MSYLSIGLLGRNDVRIMTELSNYGHNATNVSLEWHLGPCHVLHFMSDVIVKSDMNIYIIHAVKQAYVKRAQQYI
jgi:hypothetical protein